MSPKESVRTPLTLARRIFWCVFDYGAGELLLRIAAPDAAVIRRRFPQLEVMEGVPGWFEADETRDLERYPRFDIDADPAPGVLAELHAQSAARPGRRLYYLEYRERATVSRWRVWARNLSEIEQRYPDLEVVPMVLAPAAAWSTESCDLEELPARLTGVRRHGDTSRD